MQYFAEHTRRAQVAAEARPALGDEARLFNELAPCSLERRLIRLELARGQLPNPALRDVAVLPQQTHARLAVDRDYDGAPRMVHHLELGVRTVGQRHFIDRDVDHPTAEVGRTLGWVHVEEPWPCSIIESYSVAGRLSLYETDSPHRRHGSAGDGQDYSGARTGRASRRAAARKRHYQGAIARCARCGGRGGLAGAQRCELRGALRDGTRARWLGV